MIEYSLRCDIVCDDCGDFGWLLILKTVSRICISGITIFSF